MRRRWCLSVRVLVVIVIVFDVDEVVVEWVVFMKAMVVEGLVVVQVLEWVVFIKVMVVAEGVVFIKVMVVVVVQVLEGMAFMKVMVVILVLVLVVVNMIYLQAQDAHFLLP